MTLLVRHAVQGFNGAARWLARRAEQIELDARSGLRAAVNDLWWGWRP